MGEDILLQPLNIHMFGEFSIRYGEQELTGGMGRSKKVWALVEYLVANREKSIAQERLMEDLWPEEEYDNPLHILKNLVYRARIALKALCDNDHIEFISFENNCYTWNTALPCEVDTELFDLHWKKAKAALSTEEKLIYARKAFEQYTGDFLPGLSQYSWVVTKSAYYANQYTHCVRLLAQLLLDTKNYTDAVHVCELSIVYNPYEEDIHRLLLKAYAMDGRQKAAMEHYQRISQLFYDEFGVSLSSETTDLYKEIVKKMHNVEMDLAAIKDDLAEAGRLSGAFLCDYMIFKNIYRISARLMARSGTSLHIALVTVTDAQGELLDADAVKRVMPSLRTLIVQHLRRGDTVSSYSPSQLILMLPNSTRSNGCLVMDRLLGLYKQQYPMESAHIRYRLEAVDSLET